MQVTDVNTPIISYYSYLNICLRLSYTYLQHQLVEQTYYPCTYIRLLNLKATYPNVALGVYPSLTPTRSCLKLSTAKNHPHSMRHFPYMGTVSHFHKVNTCLLLHVCIYVYEPCIILLKSTITAVRVYGIIVTGYNRGKYGLAVMDSETCLVCTLKGTQNQCLYYQWYLLLGLVVGLCTCGIQGDKIINEEYLYAVKLTLLFVNLS